MAVWDLRLKTAEFRCISAEPLRCVAWHYEGKQFMSCHTDGSLATWALRPPPKPLSVSYPHGIFDLYNIQIQMPSMMLYVIMLFISAKTNKDGKLESCKPIQKVDWKTSKNG